MIESSGKTGIKGRGNYTWLYYPKKPYALKFENKASVLGMPAHKRWTLLALWTGVIGTPIMFEASRRAPAIEWTPRGRYVEVVLNGKYQGLYYLCEQTKIDKNRVNIQSLKATDTEYPNVSGGYLLEYDNQFDEKYQFYSQGFNLPVMLKSPDDNVPLEQYEYIRNYINELEVELLKIGTDTESHYADYIDIDNFVDYWITLEVLWNYEARKPRSLKMYKGRDGVDSPPNTVCKLKAGPLWDLEVLYCDQSFNTKDAHYYGALFKDSLFIERVKQRWPKFRDDLLGLTNNKSIVEYLNDVVDEIEFSSKRNLDYWGDTYFSFDTDVETVRNGFDAKIKWMDAEINKLEVIQ